ncbi:MAG: SUF system NifU family Fe-S cluster assembly protein [Candidatus Omnitrophica bacterium]|nr:SUF system NifU family Fe-S cluster assembly protein [Candidatus Omnitrophota bacterium]
MSLTDDLYREIILEHFKNPRNHGRLTAADITAQGANPFCGDELELTLALQGDTVKEVRAECKGCSISQASTSMMTEVIQGKTLSTAEELAKKFKKMMLENGPMDLPPDMEDLESLEGVKKYPVRIKCAILAWNTLLEGIEAYRRGQGKASHVEGEEGAHPDLTQQLTHESVPGTKGTGNSAVGVPSVPGTQDTQEEVRAALKTVIDPELNLNVVDLGLIYGIEVQEGSVKVNHTLTSPGCPLGPVIKGQIQGALTRIPWVKEIQVNLTWIPPWDPHTMASEEVKSELGIW